jgi:hypothetical protein
VARKRPPSIDFYYDDFLGGVAAMHPCAVGIYIKTICFQWGHDSVPNDAQTLQRITGCPPQEFEVHWPAVREKFVETADGALINERAQSSMAHKVRVAGKRSESGKKGGRPPKSKRVSKTKAKQKQTGSRKLEVGSTSLQEKLSSRYPADFERFWSAFPRGRRKSKAKAFEAWEKAIASGVDVETLLRRAGDYAKSPEGGGQYVKMPSTWLNGACWDDDDFAWNLKEQSDGLESSPGRIRKSDWSNVPHYDPAADDEKTEPPSAPKPDTEDPASG